MASPSPVKGVKKKEKLVIQDHLMDLLVNLITQTQDMNLPIPLQAFKLAQDNVDAPLG